MVVVPSVLFSQKNHIPKYNTQNQTYVLIVFLGVMTGWTGRGALVVVPSVLLRRLLRGLSRGLLKELARLFVPDPDIDRAVGQIKTKSMV